ncbi:MAG: pirin family protein, partial [Planctomycetota bacterium]
MTRTTQTQTQTQTTSTTNVEVRRAETRGTTEIGWLDSRHSFSFGRYTDRSRMGFGALRVINDDRVAPSGGFPEHPHRDMEILSWVVDGELRHQDSTGAGHTATRGTLQAMTAGSGVTHSEFNPSSASPVRFLQIWIIPERDGAEPNYRQR